MDGTGPQRPLGDSQLDRDIESALSIEPSPEFLARVRTRVAAEPETSYWPLGHVVSPPSPRLWRGLAEALRAQAGAFRRTSIEPLWGVAIVGILVAIVIPQLMREGDSISPLKPDTAAVRLKPDTTIDFAPVAQVEAEARHDVTHRAVPRTMPLQLSPALFSERDRQAFELFVVAAGEGRVPEEAANDSAGDSRRLVNLAIEPLVIDPLPVLARVQQQGEGQW